ncbi:hypothetical protein CDAR_293951 [Caerostris darwini]|uniref:Uncharacterized protein n=1 Tax=Caerostris darwini TaxID=1538125 RepID=A0AAV4VHA0_9ARAC|nr:hypothetical protein CDAR_293951 [Caerostris darwini]
MSTRWQIFVSVPTTRVGFLKKKYKKKKKTILEAAAPLILISRHLSDFSSSFFLMDHDLSPTKWVSAYQVQRSSYTGSARSLPRNKRFHSFSGNNGSV